MKRITCMIVTLIAITSISLFGQTNQPPPKPNQPPTKRCVITLELSQIHYTLNMLQHLKDSMNTVTFDIPVDREFYKSVKVGDVLNKDFRTGSLILKGSFGSWRVVIKGKREE